MFPRFLSLSRVVWVKFICAVPKDSTVKVKVARTPLPLAVVKESSVSDMSDMIPLLRAMVSVEVQTNKSCAAFWRNGPSLTPVTFKYAGLNVKSSMSHAQRPCTLLMSMFTCMVDPTVAEGNC